MELESGSARLQSPLYASSVFGGSEVETECLEHNCLYMLIGIRFTFILPRSQISLSRYTRQD